MANPDKQMVTTSWAALQIAAVDIDTGTFTIVGQNGGVIDCYISDTPPTQESQAQFLFGGDVTDGFKYTLSATQKWYVRSKTGGELISIIPAQ